MEPLYGIPCQGLRIHFMEKGSHRWHVKVAKYTAQSFSRSLRVAIQPR
jgi:hypothetical protein